MVKISARFSPYFFFFALFFIHSVCVSSLYCLFFFVLCIFIPFFFLHAGEYKSVCVCVCIYRMRKTNNTCFFFCSRCFLWNIKPIRILFYSLRACVFNSIWYKTTHTHISIYMYSLSLCFFGSLMCMFMNLVWFFDVCGERRAIFVPSKKQKIISLKEKK